jgi:ketosteroid isomerase-like protein
VQAYFDASNRHDAALLRPLLAEGCVGHVNGRDLTGPAAAEAALAALPDGTYTVLDGVREGDRVAVRWQVTGTRDGGPVRAGGLTLFRLAGGRIAELWTQADANLFGAP